MTDRVAAAQLKPRDRHGKFLVACLVTVTLGGLGVATAADVFLRVVMPEVVVLRYFPNVEVRVSGADRAVSLSGVVPVRGTGTGLPVDVSVHLDAAAAAGASAAADLVSVQVERATATGPGGRVRLEEAKVTLADQTGRTATANATGLVRSASGALELTLDLSEAVAAGWYRGLVLVLVADAL